MLKGQCHEIFDFSFFFSWISFPQAPEYTIRAISNFFQQLDIGPIFATGVNDAGVVDTGGKFATGINNTSETGSKFANSVIDTGSAPLLENISANFWKNLKRSKWDTLGLGGN